MRWIVAFMSVCIASAAQAKSWEAMNAQERFEWSAQYGRHYQDLHHCEVPRSGAPKIMILGYLAAIEQSSVISYIQEHCQPVQGRPIVVAKFRPIQKKLELVRTPEPKARVVVNPSKSESEKNFDMRWHAMYRTPLTPAQEVEERWSDNPWLKIPPYHILLGAR